MSEIVLSIKASFETEPEAKEALKKLKAAINDNDNDLNKALSSIKKITEDEVNLEMTVSDVEIKKNVISIKADTGKIAPPVWLAPPLAKLGSTKILMRKQFSGGSKIYYFLKHRKTTKKKFDAYKPKASLSAKDLEINKNLFLPEGRVSVKATLVDFVWAEGYYGEYCNINMLTESGMPIYYSGTSEALTQVTKDEFEDVCEFTATFERQKIQGEYMSVVKRPLKVKVNQKSE